MNEDKPPTYEDWKSVIGKDIPVHITPDKRDIDLDLVYPPRPNPFKPERNRSNVTQLFGPLSLLPTQRERRIYRDMGAEWLRQRDARVARRKAMRKNIKIAALVGAIAALATLGWRIAHAAAPQARVHVATYGSESIWSFPVSAIQYTGGVLTVYGRGDGIFRNGFEAVL